MRLIGLEPTQPELPDPQFSLKRFGLCLYRALYKSLGSGYIVSTHLQEYLILDLARRYYTFRGVYLHRISPLLLPEFLPRHSVPQSYSYQNNYLFENDNLDKESLNFLTYYLYDLH